MPDSSSIDAPVPVVHVVEDDGSFREALSRLLRASGHSVRTYESAEAYLASSPGEAPGCVILDVRLPGSSGLDLQTKLSQGPNPLPIVFMSGLGDVPDSVRAMKSGAVDFLTKTVDSGVLLEAVARALARDVEHRAVRLRHRETRDRYERLTAREREVFAHLLSGQLNKQIGFDLGISERTIKIHRHNVLEKMEAKSVADLVRMAADLGVQAVGNLS